MEAERQAFDQGRPFACPSAGNRLGKCGVHRLGIVAVDPDARDAIAIGAVRDVLAAGHLLERGVFGIEVVLAHEDGRKLPDRSQIERFVNRADIGSTIPERANRDAVALVELRGPGQPVGNRGRRADDPGGDHDALGRIGQVHRAALALARTGRPAGKLGPQLAQGEALAQHIVDSAVDGAKRIIIPQEIAHHRWNDFLPAIGIIDHRDLARLDHLARPVVVGLQQRGTLVNVQQNSGICDKLFVGHFRLSLIPNALKTSQLDRG